MKYSNSIMLKWDDFLLSKQKQLERELERTKRSYEQKQREGKLKDWKQQWYEREIRRLQEELKKKKWS